jgi:hypothetical protein
MTNDWLLPAAPAPDVDFIVLTEYIPAAEIVLRKMGKESHNPDASAASRKSKPFGHAALTADEKQVLSWTAEQRLAEFQKVNPSIDKQRLEAKLLFIDSMTVDNGEILDVLRVNPKTSWQIVRDIFTAGEVDGYTSTFHGLDNINYPLHFWKAVIENEREKLIRSG